MSFSPSGTTTDFVNNTTTTFRRLTFCLNKTTEKQINNDGNINTNNINNYINININIDNIYINIDNIYINIDLHFSAEKSENCEKSQSNEGWSRGDENDCDWTETAILFQENKIKN